MLTSFKYKFLLGFSTAFFLLSHQVSATAQSSFRLNASSRCINTKMRVFGGETLYFSASGKTQYGYESNPINASPITHPDGSRFVDGRSIGKKYAWFPSFSGPIGAAIGVITNGTSRHEFVIGTRAQALVPFTGSLYLCYNDVGGYYDDNAGSYVINVSR